MKKNYTISVSVEKFWALMLPMVLISIFFGGLGAIFIVDRLIMPNLPGIANRGIVSIPNIINIDYSQARDQLYKLGLRLQVQGKEYSESLARDIIISQQPKAKERVKKGRHVFVIVSKGAEVDILPDVRNVPEITGRNTLRKAGFGNIKITRAYSERTIKDNIIGTNPKHGLHLSREAPIEVTLSKGPRPTHAQVPNVIGDVLSVAKQKIVKNGLNLGKITYKITSSSNSGSVISQSVSPGVNAPLESKINLVISAKK